VIACEAETPSRREARREERRACIVALAHRLFDEHGYGGTTMSAVAAALGGSKSTLWAYFASKEELFGAVLDRLVTQFAPAIALDEEAPLEPTLVRYANDFLSMTLSPPIIALNRLVIGEASRFPELGRLFYARGPERRHGVVAGYFAAQIARGRLRPVDPLLASRQFHHLCHTGLFVRTLWSVEPTPDAAAIHQDAIDAVRLFLHGYGTEDASPAAD